VITEISFLPRNIKVKRDVGREKEELKEDKTVWFEYNFNGVPLLNQDGKPNPDCAATMKKRGEVEVDGFGLKRT
jgi:hypothetical protein